ncbi:MAG TPA: ATP-binding protein [Candidatus Bathyarchaeia archaeon]|nr:ATP-binding protein [Candidatus Bathyarchaeia archaeon]
MKLPRFYDNLEKYLKPNKVLVIYGSRQAGKTTLLQGFLKRSNLKYKLDSGDNIQTQEILSSQNFSRIEEYVSGYELLAIDEAQRIPNVGQGLKIIVDQIPGIKVIATGSSSFELAGQIGEPLTGRKRALTLFPLSQIELSEIYNPHELKERLPEWLVFGGYPEAVTAKTKQEKKDVLEEIVNSYLLKDILELERVKGSKILLDLLRLLAFQIGSEVSLTELGERLALDYKTVGRYLDLLEKSFVIFNLRGFSRNLRKEITKKSKYYFLDNGIRNAVISNFNDLNIRDDVGKLWENFLVAERMKTQEYRKISANNYFWRTWDQKEIDWIEEREGKIFGFEFKFSKKEAKIPRDFLDAYPGSTVEIINTENYLDFLKVKKKV